jgi:hypothetical protein
MTRSIYSAQFGHSSNRNTEYQKWKQIMPKIKWTGYEMNKNVIFLGDLIAD